MTSRKLAILCVLMHFVWNGLEWWWDITLDKVWFKFPQSIEINQKYTYFVEKSHPLHTLVYIIENTHLVFKNFYQTSHSVHDSLAAAQLSSGTPLLAGLQVGSWKWRRCSNVVEVEPPPVKRTTAQQRQKVSAEPLRTAWWLAACGLYLHYRIGPSRRRASLHRQQQQH